MTNNGCTLDIYIDTLDTLHYKCTTTVKYMIVFIYMVNIKFATEITGQTSVHAK